MNHTPRKRFGQHFLIDPEIIHKIVLALNPKSNDALLEIGPGKGALTQVVAPLVKQLSVVEVDRDLCEWLRATFSNITLYEADALKFDFNLIPVKTPLRVFGNLPYNISTPLLFHLLSFPNRFSDMLFMLQKEVVDRMRALPHTPDYGRLSVMIQYAAEVTSLFNVPASAFAPPPNVISSVVYLKPYTDQTPHPFAENYKLFHDIVNWAFQHRRKNLKNALSGNIAVEALLALPIDLQRRPETLSVSEYVMIANQLNQSLS